MPLSYPRMLMACEDLTMSSIQIENVPPDLHSRLRERARREGLSLSEYALEALKRHLELPPTREWLERIWSDDAVGESRRRR
jgi:post-segregation antitoxin (ccd killing protein)